MITFGSTARFGNIDEINALRKALTVTGATDVATLAGGDALRMQSLDTALKAVVQDFGHFKLYNKVPKHVATAYSDEWSEQSGIGGFLGGSTNSPIGSGTSVNGTYNRRTVAMSTFSTLRTVPFIQDVQKTISPMLAVEQMNGIKQILSDVEYLSFEGDRSVVPTEFDGLYKKAKDANTADHIINMNGVALASASAVVEAARVISGYGSFGFPSDVFWNNAVQADMDMGLESSYRVALDGNPNVYMSGSPVAGIRTLWGNIATNWDVFIRDETMMAPFQVYQSGLSALVAVGSLAVSGSATGDTTGTGKFTTGRNGTYYYAVAAISPGNGTTIPVGTVSNVVLSTGVTVAANEKVTLTITPTGAASETGYVVYRCKQDGAHAAAADFREIGRTSSTTFVDYNLELPGTSKAYVVSLTPAQDALSWSSLLDPIMLPMYPTSTPTIPFLVLSCGALRVTKYLQHVVIKNILPTGSVWRPHTGE